MPARTAARHRHPAALLIVALLLAFDAIAGRLLRRRAALPHPSR